MIPRNTVNSIVNIHSTPTIQCSIKPVSPGSVAFAA